MLQEIKLVPATILQSFSFTLYSKELHLSINTEFCASPNNFHLRADCSLCNTTLKPLTTKNNATQSYFILLAN